ncbi:MAG TPA: AsmA-like C-terminal region-containing protein [Cytophagaceae bacterium]|nr:AsmA-like C-terminal region-containing protein [Cytophagaceae bacterium]
MKTIKIIGRSFLICLIILGVVIIGFMLFFEQIKSSLIQQGVQKINQQLLAKVEVDPDIELSLFEDFPNVTLIFHNVKIYEPGMQEDPLILASMEKLTLGFDVIDVVFYKRYSLEKAFLFNGTVLPGIRANGDPNYNIFKPSDPKAPTEPIDVKIKSIVIQNVSCSYFNKLSGQAYEFALNRAQATFSIHNDTYQIGLDGAVTVNGIAVNDNVYFKNKKIKLHGEMAYNNEDGSLTLGNTSIAINESVYKIDGDVHTKEEELELHITSKTGEISTLLSLLPTENSEGVKRYQNKGDVYFDAQIQGKYDQYNTPAIDVLFGFENTDITNPEGGQSIKKAVLKGKFSNGANHNSKSSFIEIEQFEGTLNNNPIRGSFKLTNLSDPYLVIKAELKQNLKDLVSFFPMEGIDSLEGKVALSFDFEGLIKNLKKREDLEKIITSGEAQIENGGIYVKAIKKSFKDISADLIFNNTDISINSLSFHTPKSDIAVNGMIKNVLRKVLLGKGSILVEGTLHSNQLVYEDFILPAPTEKSHSESSMTSLMLFLDCDIHRLHVNNLNAKQVKGMLSYNDSLLVFSNATMNTAGGEVAGNAIMKIKLPLRSKHLTLNTAFNDIYIDSLLKDFKDFDQTFISHNNLSGRLFGKADIFFILNPDGTIVTESILANIDMDLSDGRLRNFTPMKALSRFAEEDQLNDIRFSKLTNQFLIKNKVLSIPNMIIKSNVCDIELSGTHDFDNRFVYHLKVPLKNLSKKKQQEASEKNASESGLLGKTNLFILIEGQGDQFEIKFDKKRLGKKIGEDLKKEKEELKNAFKNEEQEIKHSKVNEEEFFEFD